MHVSTSKNSRKQKEKNPVSKCETVIPSAVEDDLQYLSCSEKIDFTNIEEATTHNSFVRIKKPNGEAAFVRKSSVLWSWLKEKSRVSSDRVYRFIADKKDAAMDNESDYLVLGNYACFNFNNENVIGHVIGFRYLTGKNLNFTLSFCPIKAPEGVEPRGILVLCSLYTIGFDDLLPKNIVEYININNFVCHVSVEIVEKKIQLSKASYNNIKQYF